MENKPRRFLERLLTTPSPAGYERRIQNVWLEYVSEFADRTYTDKYGNAVAVSEGTGPEIAFTGHADEIGYIVRRIDDDGYLHLDSIGRADPTAARGQRVKIHTFDGTVSGVIGDMPIHLRKSLEPERTGDDELLVDIGAKDSETAEELVDVGDSVTVKSGVQELLETRLAARGMDDRVGIWTAAEGLRRAVEADVDATVYAASTVQEEVGKEGSKMVGFDLNPDAVVVIDVTHATDYREFPDDQWSDIKVGQGPAISRGNANHPVIVRALRRAAEATDIDTQLQARGTSTGSDADALYTTRGGLPSIHLGIPSRYMHTPVEVVDTTDIVDTADLLRAFAEVSPEYEDFAVIP